MLIPLQCVSLGNTVFKRVQVKVVLNMRNSQPCFSGPQGVPRSVAVRGQRLNSVPVPAAEPCLLGQQKDLVTCEELKGGRTWCRRT